LCQLVLTKPLPSFLAKIETLDFPGMGIFCKELDCVFVNREANDSKRKVLELIMERQKLAVEGKANPIILFPEGATTNGKSMLEFKRGAFLSLLPVQP
jgi:lysophosphatidylcholine acyltransferase/lyso-PAF acetyltransferase